MGITITGHDIDVEEAARWLVAEYLPATVRFYDYAGGDDYTAARSPQDEVTLEDLGRIVCIAGSLTYQRGHRLLQQQEPPAPWPDVDIVPLAEINDSGDAFYDHPAVEAMWQLFNFWHSKSDLAFGTVGKLLHIKWPQFIPITDSLFTSVYRDEAVRRHNASDLIRRELNSSKRTKSANVRCYWSVFRDDLVASQNALSELRDAISSLDDLSESAEGHVERLRDLSGVRLLDALVWGFGPEGKLRW